MTNYLRPDEEAMYSEIGRTQDFDRRLKSGAKNALSAATAATGAAALSSRISPFLSQYITPDLAIKGISKISPKMGEFLQKGMSMGLPIQEGLDYIRDNLNPAKEDIENKQPNQELNELGQFSPELQQFIEQQIQAGKSPDHAAALAGSEKGLHEIVKGIEKKINMPFTKFVRELYEGKAVQQQSQEAQGQPQQQPQQQGQGAQALMSILQKIQQSRGQQ